MSTASSHAAAFFYMSLKPGGGRAMGMRQANSISALAQTLRAENQVLVKTWRLPAWMASESELSVKDQLALNEQLGQLLTRGVPLVEALDVVAQSVKSSSKPRIVRLRDLVSAGSSFADGCRMVGGFDAVTTAVYKGAERSGDLGGAAKELAHSARRRLAVSGKAGTLLMYPAIVMSISVCVGAFMMLFVVPMLAGALRDADIKLPLYSEIVFGASLWLHDHVPLVLMTAGVLVVAAIIARSVIINAAKLAMRKLPVMRDVVVAQESARFFSVMAAMTRTGVPIGEALGTANQAVTHPKMRTQLERLRTRLIEGGLLRLLIDEVDSLPLATRRLMIASERSGDLDAAFNTLATDMAEEVDKRSARLLAVLEPALIVMMFLIIGSLLMAVMVPMLTITQQIGN